MTISILTQPPQHADGMTFPALSPILSYIGADRSLVAAGWRVDGKLVGLALCRLLNTNADLLSLVVRRSHRNNDGGRRLLAAVESEIHRRGGKRIEAAYSTAVPGWPALEAVFRHGNWESPTPRMEMFFTTRRRLADLMHQSIYQRYRRPDLPRDCRLVAWDGLSSEMRTEITTAGEVLDQAPIEPLVSFAVVSDAGLQCGLLSHRVKPDMIRYCRAHVPAAAHSRRGILIQLFAHAFWRHAEAGPERGCFAVFHDNASLLAVIERRMTSQGAITSTAQSRITRKSIF